MDARLGAEPLVTIESITVSKVGVSAATQAKVDEFMAAVGETRIAAQRTETAAKEAATNEALAASVSNTPGVLTSKCLDLVKESIATGALLPAGFTCWPGAGSAVVVPSAR